MNRPESQSDDRLDALLARARARRADNSAAEYAFETRLLGRLREDRATASLWARVSWRLAPVFAVCVLGLALWQAELAGETGETAAFADLENPGTIELWNAFD